MTPAISPVVSNVSRRGFLGQIFSAGALVVAAPLVPKLKAAATWQPGVYLGIEPDGTVKIVAHRSEMGTGCRTGLPMIVADELEADWARVQVVQALGDPKYGSQDTDGSCSVRDFYDKLRAAGASARTMLENAAAAKWGVPEAECRGQNHFVVHAGTGRKLAYGELAALAAAAQVPAAGRHPVQDARSVPLHRQRHPDRRSEGHGHRQSCLRALTRACRAWSTPRSSVRR